MSDISSITAPDGTTYDVKDSAARTWTTYENRFSTTLSNVDSTNSSLTLYVNTALRRVIGVLSIKFSTAWSGSTDAPNIGTIPSATYRPKGNVRVYAHNSAGYVFGMIKTAAGNYFTMNVYDGTIPANTPINVQIEWTY